MQRIRSFQLEEEIKNYIRDVIKEPISFFIEQKLRKDIKRYVEKGEFEKVREIMGKLSTEKRTPIAELVVEKCIKDADAESDIILLKNYGAEILKTTSLLSEPDKTNLLMKGLDEWFSLSKDDPTLWHSIHRILFAEILKSGLPEDKIAQVEEKINGIEKEFKIKTKN